MIPADQATTPFSRARRAMQQRYIEEIAERFPVPLVQIPLLPYEVAGLDVLRRLGEHVYGPVEAESDMLMVG